MRIFASVATVGVSNSPQVQTVPPAKAGADDAATAFRWWLIHYHDRDPVEVTCCPEVNHAKILEWYPDAIAAEPFTPSIRHPSAPLAASEETAIRAWLALIVETDSATIVGVTDQCQMDADARENFTGRAGFKNEAIIPVDRIEPDDDRRTCRQCLNLRGRPCKIAKSERGALVVANVGYRPQPDTLQRCEGYLPNATDNDQRGGVDNPRSTGTRGDGGQL